MMMSTWVEGPRKTLLMGLSPQLPQPRPHFTCQPRRMGRGAGSDELPLGQKMSSQSQALAAFTRVSCAPESLGPVQFETEKKILFVRSPRPGEDPTLMVNASGSPYASLVYGSRHGCQQHHACPPSTAVLPRWTTTCSFNSKCLGSWIQRQSSEASGQCIGHRAVGSQRRATSPCSPGSELTQSTKSLMEYRTECYRCDFPIEQFIQLYSLMCGSQKRNNH